VDDAIISRRTKHTAMIKAWIRKFIKPQIILADNECIVRMIDDSEPELHTRLGVSYDRMLEFRNLLITTFAMSGDPAETMSILSKECKHPTELALLCFALGYYIGSETDNTSEDE